MKILRILLLILAKIHLAHGQCTFFTSGKVYNATCFNTIRNIHDFSYFKPGIDIMFVKTGTSGLVILKLNSPDEKIVRNVYLYLDDNSIITLTNRSKSWVVNNERFTQFMLTASEINQLKIVNILAIRFWKCFHYTMPECENANHYENLEYEEKGLMSDKYSTVERIDFPSLITELFN